MEEWKRFVHKVVTCNIDTRHSDSRYINRLAYEKHDSDGWAVEKFRCCSCLFEWKSSPYQQHNFKDVACPECYSDKVRIAAVRLERDMQNRDNAVKGTK